jgi:transposase-like protein
MSKKYKKHAYADRLKYMHMLVDGYSIKYIHTHFGIDHRLLALLWERYQKEGPEALVKKVNTRTTASIKLKAIKDYEEKHLSLVEIMSKYDISESALRCWVRKYHAGGIVALNADGRGRPPSMGRPKKKTVEQMTELERLQKENQELKTELALLKKVRALVEERNARLYEIGHKPSKD